MKWCVTFPEEDILIKRPSLKRACGGNKQAATFLSYLLYQVSISNEYRKNAESLNKRKMATGEAADQVVTGNVYRTQSDIIAELDNELSDRTLRDNARPWLQALGYIEVDTSQLVHIYIVHLDKVQKGINHPPTQKRELKLIQECFASIIGKTSDDSGKTSDDSGKTSDDSGKTSDDKNGTRAASRARRGTQFQNPKSNKSNYKITKRVVARDIRSEKQSSAPSAAAAVDFHDLSIDELNDLQAKISSLLESKQQERLSTEASQSFANEPDEVEQHTTSPDDESASELVESETHSDHSTQQDDLVLQRPATDGSMTAMQCVQLVEYLRGQRYDCSLQVRQLRAAQNLFQIDPPLTLDEVEEAWRHGSDDYWRLHHGGDNMHVSDLANKEVSSGKVRILAILAHKRQQDRSVRSGSGRSHGSLVSRPHGGMSESDARALARLIEQQAATCSYSKSIQLRIEPDQDYPEQYLVKGKWNISWAPRSVPVQYRDQGAWKRHFTVIQEEAQSHLVGAKE